MTDGLSWTIYLDKIYRNWKFHRGECTNSFYHFIYICVVVILLLLHFIVDDIKHSTRLLHFSSKWELKGWIEEWRESVNDKNDIKLLYIHIWYILCRYFWFHIDFWLIVVAQIYSLLYCFIYISLSCLSVCLPISTKFGGIAPGDLEMIVFVVTD